MAYDLEPRMVHQVATPRHYSPPTARELRAQAVHRLQVGLFGLAAMLLLVGLANIIMDRARQADKDNSVAAAVETAQPDKKPASDPLADIGVVPAADPSPTATPTPTPTSAPAPALSDVPSATADPSLTAQ